MSEIRMVNRGDIPALKQVLVTLDLIPPELLEEMMSNYLNDPESKDIWFTGTVDEKPVSIGYCAPEWLTEGTYNLLALGVRSDIQAQVMGSRMLAFIEDHLKANDQRLLISETSSLKEYEPARRFYEKSGYSKEGVIRDFWDDGDDKVIYSKKFH